ncbi:GAF domain-containing protein [Pseudonocardia sp. CA-107938]|uniref:GAF domain-containing protein n=1 Tax=Pseudonocardia sp. CA-107938 TaxID=3240021 RepID=UPI003D94D5E4
MSSEAQEQFLGSGEMPSRVRELVAESWRRSVAAGVSADDEPVAPLLAQGGELAEYRDAHPLSRVFPLLYDVLGRAAEECDSVMAVGDAQGQLLWVCGTPGTLARAERINFVEGSAWAEAAAGTNAPGTALRLDAPVQIRAAEHFVRAVQPWSCVAAPIHDPATQAVLGIVDITGGDDVASPQTMGMVRAAARMAEAELGRLLAIGAPAPRRVPRMAIDALGRPDCQVTVGGKVVRLSPRHSEIVVILADRPDGMSGDELAIELYRDDVRASTTRAELTRLRGLLDGLLDSRPYRLPRDLRCDWHDVQDALEDGRIGDALRAYRGPLLPQSDAPGVVERRERLELRLRTALIASGDLELMAAWTRSRWGADDLQMWQHQTALLPASAPLRRIALSEVRRLDAQLRW